MIIFKDQHGDRAISMERTFFHQSKTISSTIVPRMGKIVSTCGNIYKKNYMLESPITIMLRDVKPFDDRQWNQLQEDKDLPLTKEQKVKMVKIREGVQEISRLMDF